MQPIKLTTKQARPIVQATYPEYTGRKFSLEFRSKITFYDTNWSGGTKNYYKFVASDGRTAVLNVPAPWFNTVEGQTFEIPENVMVVEHTFFCGKDFGIRIYAHPVHAPKWLEG